MHASHLEQQGLGDLPCAATTRRFHGHTLQVKLAHVNAVLQLLQVQLCVQLYSVHGREGGHVVQTSHNIARERLWDMREPVTFCTGEGAGGRVFKCQC